MYARVAMYHGADAAGIDKLLAESSKDFEARFEEPGEGLAGIREFFLLVDRESGRGLGIALFDSQADLQRGEEELDRMPLSQAGGVRTGVERYEVAWHLERT